jgi:threonine synthase
MKEIEIHYHYRCSECNATYDFSPNLMLCPLCRQRQKADEPLKGILELKYFGQLDKLSDLWPVSFAEMKKIPTANTALWKSPRLQEKTGFHNLWLKDDTRNLSSSYKDRASLLVAAVAKQYGIGEIVVASTGNAASSMAAIGAFLGLKITIFLPESAPKAKIVQSLQYGARVIPVAGNYDLAFELSLQYTDKYKLLNRNTAYNPLTIEGKKSAAFEIFHQLGKVPDYCFVPTGDGVILSGIYKGFADLYEYGFSVHLPQIIAVQSNGSAALHHFFQTGVFSPVKSNTIADSISVDIPRGAYYAVKQMRKYHGNSITVSDDEILSAQKELSQLSGLFAEPAAAAAYAGFLKHKTELPPNADIVLLITGSGLKDVDAAMSKVQFPQKSIRSIEDI